MKVGALPGTGTGAPTRSGYKFEGWSRNPDAVKADFFEDYIVDFYDSINLYAVWSKSSTGGEGGNEGGNGGIEPPKTADAPIPRYILITLLASSAALAWIGLKRRKHS
jgi:uncharacterized repeat protein (TIGR02543 family)